MVYLTSKLNWETYKQIPVKLREEFNYKYGKAPTLSIGMIINGTIFIFLMATIFMAMVALTIESEKFNELEDSIVEMVDAAGKILQFMPIFFLVIIIADGINYYVWFYRRRKWMKKHNIEMVYPLIDKIRKWWNERR